MEKVIVSELENWKEVGFKRPVKIYYIDELRRTGKPFQSVDVDFYGPTFHSSLQSVKAAIRKEHSIKSTPKFKWRDAQ